MKRRGFIRRLGRYLVVIAILGASLLGISTALFYSDTGQGWIREYVADAVSSPGYRQVEIDELSVGLSGEASARLTVSDGQGHPVATVGEARVEVDVAAVLFGEIVIESLEASDLTVAIRIDEHGRSNVDELFKSASQDEGAPLSIADIAVERGRVTLARVSSKSPTTPTEMLATFAIEELQGTIDINPNDKRIAISRGRMKWNEREIAASASGTLALEASRLALRDVLVQARESELTNSEIDLSFETGEISMRGQGALAHRDIRWLCETVMGAASTGSSSCAAIEGAVPGDIAIARATATRESGAAPWAIAASLVSGASRVSGDIAVEVDDELAVSGALEAREIAFQPLFEAPLPELVASSWDLDITIDRLVGTSLRDARGALSLRARTRNQILGNASAKLDISVPTPGQIAARIAAPDPAVAPGSDKGGKGPDALVARFNGEIKARYSAETLALEHVERARLSGRIPALARVTGRRIAGVGEALELELDGPWHRMKATGRAVLTGVSSPGLGSMQRGEIDFELSDLSGAELAGLRLPRRCCVSIRANGLARGPGRIASLSGEGTIFYRNGRLETSLGATAKNATLAATGSEVVIEEARTNGTRVTWHSGDLRVALGSYQLDTPSFSWRGEGGAIARDKRGRLGLAGIRAFSPSGQIAIDGTLAARGERDELIISATDLDLAAIAAVYQLPLTGQASGNARLYREDDPRKRGQRGPWRILGDTEFRRLSWQGDGRAKPGAQGAVVSRSAEVLALDGSAYVDLEEDRLVLYAKVQEPATKSQISIAADVQPPADPFDTAAWKGLTLDRADRIYLSSEGIDLEAAYVLLGASAPAVGRIAGTVELKSAQKPEIEFSLAAQSLTVTARDRVYGDLDGELSGHWRQSGLTARAAIGHRDEPLLTGDGTLELSLPDLWRELSGQPVARMVAAPLDARVRADQLDVTRLVEAGWLDPWVDSLRTPGSPAKLIGQLTGQLEIRGSVAAPTFTLRDTAVYDVYAMGLAFERLTVEAEGTRDYVTGTLAASQPGQGALHVVGGYYANQTPDIDLDIKAEKIDLSFARAFASRTADIYAGITGMVDASLRIQGDPFRPEVSGSAELRGGGLWLAGGRRRIHSVDATLTMGRDSAGDHIVVRDLKGYLDRGKLEASGRIELDALVPRTFRGRVTADELALLLSEYRAAISADAEVTASYARGELDATIRVDAGSKTTRARVDISETSRELQSLSSLDDVVYIDQEALEAARSRDGDEEERDSRLHTIRLKIMVPKSPRAPGVAVRFIEEPLEARVWARPDPALEVEFRNWSLARISGSIAASSGSKVVLWDHEYDVEEGRLSWQGRSFIPTIDTSLVGEFPAADTTVFVQVGGNLIEPVVALEADIVADETTVLAIMNGADPDDPGSIAYATVTSNLNIISRLQKRLPKVVRPDVVRIYADGFSIGKYFSQLFLIGYRNRSEPEAKENQHEVNVRARLRRNLVVEGQYGDKDVGGLDLLWRIRF